MPHAHWQGTPVVDASEFPNSMCAQSIAEAAEVCCICCRLSGGSLAAMPRSCPAKPTCFDKWISAMCCCVNMRHWDVQYSKFIKNGWTILDTSTDASTLAAMYQPQNSNMELAVVTTNTDTSSTKTNWDFGSMPEQIAVEVYRTSASENFTQLADVLLPISGLLQYDLPAQSITTFYFTVEADTTAPASATAG